MDIVRFFILMGVVLYFSLIIYSIKRRKLLLKYTILWLFFGLAMFVVAAFPQIIFFTASILGFETPAAALFSLLFFLIIIILLFITSIVSDQSEKIKTLIQTNSLLEKRIRDLEKVNK